MMKRKIWLGGLAMVWASLASSGEYKCFVVGGDGDHHIVFNEAQSSAQAATVAREQTVVVGVNRPLVVTSVVECAKLDDLFRTGAANRLDEKFPR